MPPRHTTHQLTLMRRRQQLASRKRQLDQLFEQAAATTNREMQAHLARYLCVLVSGFIEVTVRTTYSLYVSRQSAPNVTRFVDGHLDFFQNPTVDRIYALADRFSVDWKVQLQAAVDQDVADAVNSIVANRNLIAHGESVGLTLGTIKDYFARAIRLLDLVERQCAGQTLTAMPGVRAPV